MKFLIVLALFAAVAYSLPVKDVGQNVENEEASAGFEELEAESLIGDDSDVARPKRQFGFGNSGGFGGFGGNSAFKSLGGGNSGFDNFGSNFGRTGNSGGNSGFSGLGSRSGIGQTGGNFGNAGSFLDSGFFGGNKASDSQDQGFEGFKIRGGLESYDSRYGKSYIGTGNRDIGLFRYNKGPWQFGK